MAAEGVVDLAEPELGHGATRCTSDIALLIQSIRERERTRLARFLHDDIGQDLALVRGDLVDLVSESPADAKRLRGSLEDLDRVIGRLRAQVGDLLGPACDVWDFLARTLDLTERITERGRMVAQTVVNATVARLQFLDNQSAAAAWSAVRKALNNAERHSQGSLVTVTIDVDEGWLVATVEDDGRGSCSTAAGHGTRLMTECIQLAGGSLRCFTPADGRDRGTCVRIAFPLGGG